MNWVREKEAESFRYGYNEGVLAAAKALADENLVCVSCWLSAEMDWRRNRNRQDDSDSERPGLADFLKEATSYESAQLDPDAERLKRIAPELLRILKIFYSLYYEGVKSVHAKYPSVADECLKSLIYQTREAISTAESL